MKIKAYRNIERRLSECRTDRLRTPAQREAFAAFSARIHAAVRADPTEHVALDIPENEWDAYSRALDDRSGG